MDLHDSHYSIQDMHDKWSTLFSTMTELRKVRPPPTSSQSHLQLVNAALKYRMNSVSTRMHPCHKPFLTSKHSDRVHLRTLTIPRIP